MDQASPTRADSRNLAQGAKSLVEVCVRNTLIEGLHAGIFPGSETGDYSDVKVVTPYGEIPWVELSRISDDEMKRLMVEIVNRVFSYLSYPDELAKLSPSAQKWAQPRLDSNLMKTVRRRKAAAAPSKDIST
jgi:hypothetical protein